MHTELPLSVPAALRSRPMAPQRAIAPSPHTEEHARIAAVPSWHVARVCAAVSMRRRVRRGELVVRAGQPLETLIWVGSGLLLSDAGERVADFHLAGDIVGMSGIASGVHPFDIRALEDGNLRLAPFALIEQLANTEPQLLKALHRAMSAELLRQHQLATVMACPSAEGRLAAFLADLWTRRPQADDRQFVLLPMSRAEIGSYLGLTMESISRGFARLARRGLVDVRRRRLRIVDLPRLRAFATGHPDGHAPMRRTTGRNT